MNVQLNETERENILEKLELMYSINFLVKNKDVNFQIISRNKIPDKNTVEILRSSYETLNINDTNVRITTRNFNIQTLLFNHTLADMQLMFEIIKNYL